MMNNLRIQRNGKCVPRLFVFPVALDPTEEGAAAATIFHLLSSNEFEFRSKEKGISGDGSR